MDTISDIDFFISYNQADQAWAEWIAWQLERAGHSTIIDAWDFKPGSNWALAMDTATRRAERIIVVLSNSFLAKRVYTRPEFAAYFAIDPDGARRLLVPVMVEQCQPDGLLRQLVPIRLMETTEERATKLLLDGLSSDRRPRTTPRFPGNPAPPFPPVDASASDVSASDVSASVRKPVASPDQPAARLPDTAPVVVDWIADDAWPRPRWLTDLPGGVCPPGRVLEVHLVPDADHPPLSSARLHGLGSRLVALGRGGGLFTAEQSVEQHSGEGLIAATAGAAGLAALRTGQRSVWCGLPTDDDVRNRLPALLSLAAQLLPDTADRVAAAAGITPDGRRSPSGRHLPATVVVSACRDIADELSDGLVS